VKIENFPFRDGEGLTVNTYTGHDVDGTLVAINPDAVILCTVGSNLRMIPWSNVADVYGKSLGNDRVREIAETFTRPKPITDFHPTHTVDTIPGR
jgi:hypothetical protein